MSELTFAEKLLIARKQLDLYQYEMAERLEVERRAQATPARVEKLASERLHMVSITPAISNYSQAAASQPQGAQ